VLDYSEISGRFAHAPEALLPPALRVVLKRALGAESEGDELVLAPAVRARLLSAEEEYAGSVAIPPDYRMLAYELRAGARPHEHQYFSAALLATEAHLAYLNDLQTVLAAHTG
jgi:hypothetical protein